MKEVKKKYLKWYEDMLLWRKFEDKLAALYIQQKVRGFYIYTTVKKRY
jgi:pyruvate dehydrogenase E1 component alpha subunit